MRIGLISDTHGLLRPQAIAALRGSDYIVHAGDIGSAEILERLRAIAPLTVVRGNNDHQPWARELPVVDVLEVGGIAIVVVHDPADIDLHGHASCRVAVSGHSHRPALQQRDGVLYVNPGSAGPRRFTLPVTLARLHVTGGEVAAEIVTLLQ